MPAPPIHEAVWHLMGWLALSVIVLVLTLYLTDRHAWDDPGGERGERPRKANR